MYWIEGVRPGRLAIAARPRAGDWLVDEIEAWRIGGVNCVISLLEDHEVRELELQDESAACGEAGLTFLSFPIQDRGTPESLMRTRELVDQCRHRLSRDEGLLVHCRAGIGRSSLMIACMLAASGADIEELFKRISAARGVKVPDIEAQIEWVRMFATT